MSTEIIRTKFQAGAEIPEWILIAEPIVPNAIQGKFTFGTPVDVFDMEDQIVILPCVYGPLPPVINFSGSGCKIMASSKPVRVVNGMGTFQTENVDMWGSMIGIVGAAPVQTPVHQPAQAWTEDQMRLAARPSFWQRLKTLF